MRRSTALGGFLATLLIWAATYQSPPSHRHESDRGDGGPQVPAERHSPFPDFGFLPPKDQYDGELFRLRQDYPTAKPGDDQLPDFLKIPFDQNGDGQQNWKKYLLQVRDYCFEGNIDTEQGHHRAENI